MFKFISQFADRYRVYLIIGWVGLAVLITLVAPNLDDVISNDQSDFLPDDSPSQVGQDLIESYFPDQVSPGNIVVVFESDSQGQVLSDENAAFIDAFSKALMQDTSPEYIQGVQSPTFSPELAGALTSVDGQVAMVVVSLNTSDSDQQAEIYHDLDKYLNDTPAGLTTYRTGSSAIFTQYNESLTTSVERTIIVTIALVILMLLVIYRSPVSPFIPLGVVTIAYLIARGIVAFLAENTLTVSGTASMLLIVVMYGAGTDYCLFLISRFREELATRDEVRPSVRSTVRRVGESITSSAGTVITGFLALSVAQLGLFSSMGPTLAIGVITSLLAGLTLTPALLGLLGSRTFWPGQAKHRSTGALYRRTSRLVSGRPLLAIIVIALVMVPFAVYGFGRDTSFDFLADLPDDAEAVEGFRVLEDHIGPGEMQPINSVAVLDSDLPYADIEKITADILAIDAVSDVRSATQPLGVNNQQTTNITRIDKQLFALGTLMQPNPDVEPTQEQVEFATALGAQLPDYFALLANAAPDITQTAEFAAIQTEPTPDNILALAQVAPPVHIPLTELPPTVVQAFGGDAMIGLVDGYVNGNAARFEVVLDTEPYSRLAMDTVNDLNGVFSDYADKYGVAGLTADNANLRNILDQDTRLTFGLVLVGVFIVLLVMLRSVVAPTYLIGTIILSYTTTLGITSLVSGVLWGQKELTWWVPFFMFVFLVALGIDYSIFLFGRIKEEVSHYGIHEGIHQAVVSTGSIITSAGVIVAGTFGAMMTGEIVGLAQIGFAVSVGILIDTFVVRTVLVPALALLFGKWTWFPGGVPETTREAGKSTVPGGLPQPGGAD